MTKYERHPAPEKLLLQITTETINALALGTPDKIGDVAPLETGVELIAKAWGLPQGDLEASLALIQREKELVLSGSSEAALPDKEMLEPYDGDMIVELLWGLLDTSVRLEDVKDRAAVYELALLLAESLNLKSWIAGCGTAAEARTT